MLFQNMTDSDPGEETPRFKFARALAGAGDRNTTPDRQTNGRARLVNAATSSVQAAYGRPVRVNPNTPSRIPRPAAADAQSSSPPLNLPGAQPNPVPRTLMAGIDSQPRPVNLGTMLANQGAPQMDPRIAQAKEALAKDSTITSKNDPKYRMGIGGRILGSLANFASGMAGSGRPPVYVGPGATNRAYDQAEQDRKNRMAADQAQIDLYQDQYNNAVAQRRNELQDYAAMQPIRMAESQPIASAPASQPQQPGQPQPAQQKSVTKGQVLVLARKHNVPYAVAAQQFKDKGYVIK